MNILEPVDDNRVEYHSSVMQNKGVFGFLQAGEWCYLSYDEIDYVGCDGIKYTRCALVDDDNIGYNFDVKDLKFYTDTYVYHDNRTTELRSLPTWFGDGFYRYSNESYAFINADNGSLGTRNEQNLRVGLSYALANKTLTAVA